MLHRNIIIGFLLMVVSAVFFVGTWSFPDVGGHISPRVFPRIIAGCMFVLAAILTGRSVVERLRTTPEKAPSSGLQGYIKRWWRIVALAVVGFAYTQVLDSLGYVVATAPFLAAMVLLFQEKRWYVVAAVSILGTSLFYWVFRMVFKVPLPRFDLF